MMRRLIAGTLLAALSAGCSDNSDRMAYDGVQFRVKARKAADARDVFEVRVRRAGLSLAGARLAAHHAGVGYCVGNYGSSEILWTVDPLDETRPVPIDDGDAVYTGRCPQARPLPT